MLYPLTFQPVFMERVWGGRKLESLYGKPLPPGVPIGESWEISDREEAVNLIANGPFAGKDLRWLIENHEPDLLGGAPTQKGRFPLLVKILDAQQKLSLQVHPPASVAAELDGHPKTEMWVVADAEPEADIFAGLKRGVTREQFEAGIKDGTLAECFHRIAVRKDDAMFLPSGRAHALGAGCVIFEIQQNSDTTYRVFDWNRVGLDGKPRQLHIDPALKSIDFEDFEPELLPTSTERHGSTGIRQLVRDPLFDVDEVSLDADAALKHSPGKCTVIGVLSGDLALENETASPVLKAGDFALLPAAIAETRITTTQGARFLTARPN